MKREIIGVLLAAFTLSACHEKGDIYDPNYNPDFGVSVPDDFDWSTTKTLTVNVEVDDLYNGKYYYAVRVYDKVPNEGVLPVAASGEVTGDMPFSQEIVVSSDVTKLYIVQSFKNANATEYVVTKEVAIDSNVITYSFKSTGKSVRTAIARDDDGTSITEANQIKAKGKYLIRKGVTISVDNVEGNLTDVEIKIEGELVFTGSNEKLSGWKIEVDDEDDGIGKLRATNGLTLDGGCKLDNDGEVYISGDFKVESGAQLENDGCIIVEGVAHIQSHIELDEKSYMYCRSMQLGGNGGNNVYIYMETSAWLKIEGSLQMNSKAKIGFGEDDKGFKSPDDDDYVSGTKYVALIQVGSWQNGNSGNLTVNPEILVEAPSKIDGISSWTQDASGFLKKIPSVVCSGKGGEEIEALLGEYTYIMEDQYPNKGDYDMNDVVISMTSRQKGKRLEIEGKLRAAGANYTIVPYIKVGNETQPLFEDEKSVYKALTGKDDLPSPVNTNINGIRDCESATFKRTFKGVKSGLSQNDIDLYIIVNGTTKINMDSNKNPDAWVMCISGLDFQYPLEGVNIEEAYPDFKEWMKGSTSWYKNPIGDKVMKNEE